MTRATLVVGTGYVGQRFVTLQNGALTLGLSRSPISVPHNIKAYDLDAGGPLPLTLPDQYAVLYTVPPSAESISDVRLQRLLDVLTPAPQRFVYISTTGVYGNRDGATVDEESNINPLADRARRRVSAEDSVRAWGEQCDCAIVILRVPGIYGPGRLGVERIQDRLPVIAENDTGPGNRIHVDDLVNCCAVALTPRAQEGVYNVGDGDHRSSTWFTIEVARQCRLEPPPTISMQDAASEFSPMRLSFLKESRNVDTRKMREVLGITPKYANAEDGIRASLLERSLERD